MIKPGAEPLRRNTASSKAPAKETGLACSVFLLFYLSLPLIKANWITYDQLSVSSCFSKWWKWQSSHFSRPIQLANLGKLSEHVYLIKQERTVFMKLKSCPIGRKGLAYMKEMDKSPCLLSVSFPEIIYIM